MELLDQCVKDSGKLLDMESYMIMPVQRMPRYVILLKALIEYTPPDHVDYDNLVSAYEKMQEVVGEINEAKRKYENQQRLLELAHNISGPHIKDLVEVGRKYIAEVQLSNKDGSQHLFLFNDLLLVANKEYFLKGFTLEKWLPLSRIISITNVKNDEETGKSFIKLDAQSASKPSMIKTYSFSFQSDGTQNQWYNLLLKTHGDYKGNVRGKGDKDLVASRSGTGRGLTQETTAPVNAISAARQASRTGMTIDRVKRETPAGRERLMSTQRLDSFRLIEGDTILIEVGNAAGEKLGNMKVNEDGTVSVVDFSSDEPRNPAFLFRVQPFSNAQEGNTSTDLPKLVMSVLQSAKTNKFLSRSLEANTLCCEEKVSDRQVFDISQPQWRIYGTGLKDPRTLHIGESKLLCIADAATTSPALWFAVIRQKQLPFLTFSRNNASWIPSSKFSVSHNPKKGGALSKQRPLAADEAKGSNPDEDGQGEKSQEEQKEIDEASEQEVQRKNEAEKFDQQAEELMQKLNQMFGVRKSVDSGEETEVLKGKIVPRSFSMSSSEDEDSDEATTDGDDDVDGTGKSNAELSQLENVEFDERTMSASMRASLNAKNVRDSRRLTAQQREAKISSDSSSSHPSKERELPANMMEWTTEDTVTWLKTMKECPADLIRVVQERGITGEMLVKSTTHDLSDVLKMENARKYEKVGRWLRRKVTLNHARGESMRRSQVAILEEFAQRKKEQESDHGASIERNNVHKEDDFASKEKATGGSNGADSNGHASSEKTSEEKPGPESKGASRQVLVKAVEATPAKPPRAKSRSMSPLVRRPRPDGEAEEAEGVKQHEEGEGVDKRRSLSTKETQGSEEARDDYQWE